MSCSHPSGRITDHAVQAINGLTVRYAWRGACIDCSHGVVGSTSLPAGLHGEELSDRLNQELMVYLGYAGSSAAAQV